MPKTPAPKASQKNDPLSPDARRTAGITGLAALVGLGSILVYAYATAATNRGAAAVVGVGALMSGAAALVGALLGFLFGIPRTMQQARVDNGEPEGQPTEKTGQPNKARPRYLVNTNLEQISDWLTKIFVGLGLTQLNTIPTKMWAYSGELAPAIGGGPIGQVVVLVVAVYFATDGFFFGYLLTRLFLTEAFMRAERGLEEIAEQVATAVAEKATSQIDSRLVAQEVRTALYLPPPEGFRQAIRLGERLLTQIGAESMTPDLWAYLACAYGQKYAWSLAQGVPREELIDLRSTALNAVRQAAQDPEWRELLRSVWRPAGDSKENDLASFRDDEDFAKALV